MTWTLGEHMRERIALRATISKSFALAVDCWLRGSDDAANAHCRDALPAAEQFVTLGECRCEECRRDLFTCAIIGSVGISAAMLLVYKHVSRDSKYMPYNSPR